MKRKISLDSVDERQRENLVREGLEIMPYYNSDLCDRNPKDYVALNDVISALSEREREILDFRYGLNGSDKKTYREIGEKFMLDGDRVRQIHYKVLRKLGKSLVRLLNEDK